MYTFPTNPKCIKNYSQTFTLPEEKNPNLLIVPEIPLQVIEKFLFTIDADKDKKISVNELKEYISSLKLLTVPVQIADEMFKEIVERRTVSHQSQFADPITFEELVAVCYFK